jgi:hypothetical protein
MARQYLNLAEVYGAVDRSRANQMDMENARMQQEQFRNQVARQQRAEQEAEAIKGIYRGAIETDETGAPRLNEKRLITDLYGIAPEKALETQQGFTKRDSEASKLKREEQKAAIENKTATAKYLRDRLATVQDEVGYQGLLQEANELGATDLVRSAPPQFDPNWQRSQMVNADKFLEQNTPKYERVDLGGKIQIVDVNPVTNPAYAQTQLNKTQTPDSLASNAISIRGQNMTAARADEANRLKSEENAIKRNEKVPENSTALRKEFDDLPEVKNYKQALPAYKGIEDAVKRNTTASDINIVYGIAKLYDPTSVVREGEYATVANSPNIPEKIKGYAQYLNNGGRLTEATKKQILTEAQSRMTGFEGEYKSARDNYTSIAKRSNADPSLLFPSEFKSAITKAPAKASTTTSPLSVTAPNGKTYTFKSQAAANEFKRQAGIK